MSRVLFAVILGLSTTLGACGGKDKPAETAPPSSGHTPPTRTPDATYTVRGEVTMLPVEGDKRTEFKVHHEAIPTFKNKDGVIHKDKDGKEVGMMAMTMEFPPAKGVDLSKLKKGDKVSVTFSVWWGNSPSWLAVKVEKLPDDTKLDFGAAKPAAPASSVPAEPAKPAESAPAK